MSASDKKKLRKEQEAGLLTEKQRQQRDEDKKLKIYSIAFIAVMALVVCVTLGVLGVRAINNSGIIQKSTIAATIGDRQLNSVELSYYYNDAVNEMYSQWYSEYESNTDSYLQVMGLDTSKPLNKQVQDQQTGLTWDQHFVNEAIKQAKSDFALCDLAKAENFTLPEEKQTELDNIVKNIETYAMLYGYSNSSQYLRASYGYGADAESYAEYLERGALADAYAEAHLESITYDDAQIREYESGKADNYNSYTYASVYLSQSDFIKGGTKGENGIMTYSDEEKEAARAAVKAAAEDLATATTVEELKEKLKALELNEGSTATVNEKKDEIHTAINGTLNKWLADTARQEGDIEAIPNSSTSKNDAGEEVTVTNGYYVALFQNRNDNTDKLANVRHLLVKFTGGTKDEESNETVYSEAEKAAAKEKAEEYLKKWLDGEATEESFIELVKEYSDDTSASTGGLFEDIHRESEYVPEFLDWSISADRKTGDAEVIETQYGYHVMYYVGDDALSYRDFMITEEMRAEDQDEWYQGILETVTTSTGDTSKLKLDLVISPM